MKWESEAESWLIENAQCLAFPTLCTAFSITANRRGWQKRTKEAISLKLHRMGLSRKTVYDSLTVKDLAAMLNISAERVKAWMRRGLTAKRVGHHWAIQGDALASFFKGNPDEAIAVNHEALGWVIGHDAVALIQASQCSKQGVSRPVQCIESNQVYDTVKQAARRTGIDRRRISHAAVHGTMAGGFHWTYRTG